MQCIANDIDNEMQSQWVHGRPPTSRLLTVRLTSITKAFLIWTEGAKVTLPVLDCTTIESARSHHCESIEPLEIGRE